MKKKDEEQQKAKEELQRVIEQMSEDVQNKKEESIDEFETLQEENAIISYQELVNNVKTEKMSFNLEDIYEEDALEEMKEEVKQEKLDESIEEIEDEEQDEIIENIEIDDNKTNEFTELFEDEEDKKDIINEMFESKTNFSSLLDDEDIDEDKIMEEIKEVPKEEPVRKYKRSEIISPIYGRQNVDVTYPKISTFDRNKDFKDSLLEIEQNLKDEPLTDEETKNEEFLNTLKEFRRNL